MELIADVLGFPESSVMMADGSINVVEIAARIALPRGTAVTASNRSALSWNSAGISAIAVDLYRRNSEGAALPL